VNLRDLCAPIGSVPLRKLWAWAIKEKASLGEGGRKEVSFGSEVCLKTGHSTPREEKRNENE